MIFYHGTTQDNWDKIQEEGVLFGRRCITNAEGNPIREIGRCTYLAADIKEAQCYGNIILSVEYDPLKNKKANNYIDGCWQVRVYEPIPIKNVKVVK